MVFFPSPFIVGEEIDGFSPKPVWLERSFAYNQNVLPVTKSWSGDSARRCRLVLLQEPRRPCGVAGDRAPLPAPSAPAASGSLS